MLPEKSPTSFWDLYYHGSSRFGVGIVLKAPFAERFKFLVERGPIAWTEIVELSLVGKDLRRPPKPGAPVHPKYLANQRTLFRNYAPFSLSPANRPPQTPHALGELSLSASLNQPGNFDKRNRKQRDDRKEGQEDQEDEKAQ